jgi:hypothetical protein
MITIRSTTVFIVERSEDGLMMPYIFPSCLVEASSFANANKAVPKKAPTPT